MLPLVLVIMCARLVSAISKVSGRGAGATWPGEIALRLRPDILEYFFRQALKHNKKIIGIAGTNGKTTTAKMLETILKEQGFSAVRNASGANLDNGIVSCFIANATLTGELVNDLYIFEIDEATLPHLLRAGTTDILILMNLFRDQLDRYGEVDAIAERWSQALSSSDLSRTTVLINGDDPHLAYIGEMISQHSKSKMKNSKADVLYFGLNNPELFLPVMQHATDSIFCPSCGNRLTFGGVYFSHLGKYACGRCGFKHPHVTLSAKEVTSPLEGVYNIYNTLAATLCASALEISAENSKTALQQFSPAFGRMEQLRVKDKNITMLLSKNPTGWNESIRTLLSNEHHGPLLLVLNNRVPDGQDISWIYDVDFEQLSDTATQQRITAKRKQKMIHALDEEQEVQSLVQKQKILLSGDRAYDLATRLEYADVAQSRLLIFEQLSQAVETGIAHTHERETLYILPTYSAMLEVRKILTGKGIA